MANKGIGAQISKGGVVIGSLTEIKGIDMSQDTMDVTTLDTSSGYKTNITGWKDGGEVSISGFFVPGDSGQAAMISGYDAGTEDTYVITFPSAMAVTWTFTGLITKITTGIGLSDPVSFDATIKVNGKPTLGTTASTGISAATFVQTDGSTALTAYAITPTFAIGTYTYGTTFTTQTAIKVKMTAASHTIKCYVDDVYLEDLTSGSASANSIAFGSALSKKITIICYEVNKTPKTYTFMVSRTS